MNPALYCVGLDHRTAPLALRERCAVASESLSEALLRVRGRAEEAVILSTCGRVEVYFVPRGSRAEPIANFADAVGVGVPGICNSARVSRDRDVVRHLLRVAAGLESQIIGEDHVQAQVRRAFLAAQQAGTCGAVLSALGRAAVHTGKRVRHETPINSIPRSFARLAIQELLAKTDSSSMRQFVIIGTGALAREVATELGERFQAAAVCIAGRDPQRTRLLCDELGASPLHLEQLSSVLQEADALFACTSSPRFIITSRALTDRHRPLYLYDLGLPRNIDPAVAGSPFTRLRHLDELAPAPAHQPLAVAEACAIVEQETERFARWQRARRVAPLLSRMDRLIGALEPGAAQTLRRVMHGHIIRLRDGSTG